MRFLYCACVISATLGDWRGMQENVVSLQRIKLTMHYPYFIGVDIDLAEKYIMDCYTYEGGISLVPGHIIYRIRIIASP